MGGSVCQEIDIEDDDKLEDDEQFTYTLSSDDPVEFLASSGTVTIEDDDSTQTPALNYNSCGSR